MANHDLMLEHIAVNELERIFRKSLFAQIWTGIGISML